MKISAFLFFGFTSALADGEDAHKKRAFTLLAEKRWEEGIRALDEGYAATKNNGFLYNKAVAYEKWTGHCEETIAAYRAFLEECRACGKHLVAKERLAMVELECGATPTGATPKEQTVEGWADVTSKGITDARQRAILDAQRRAVEVVAGIQLSAMMKDESQSSIRGQRERFRQDVESRVLSKSAGFVRTYRVLDEGQDGPVYKVLVRAVVDDPSIGETLTSIAKRLADARFPKIMFVVKEEYTGRDGKASDVAEPTLLAVMEDALIGRGFDLVAKDRVEALRREEARVLYGVIDDHEKASKLATDQGAEYIVTAVARVRFTSFDDFHQGDFHGHAELSLEAIHASTGAVIASDKKSGPSPGNCFNEADLRIRTVKNIAPPLVSGLVDRITESWDRDQKQGIRYAVKLHGVKSYSKEALVFMDVLRRLPGVLAVQEISFAEGRLEVELFYPATFDVSHLMRAVLAAAPKKGPLAGMDVEHSKGRQLNFALVKR